MGEYKGRDGIIRRVVSSLETAPKGSQELDCMITYALKLARGEFDQVMMELLVNEGFSWNIISEIWEGKVAPYTQSLDSGIEGEDIAFVMRSDRRAQWAAVHKAPGGSEYVAWAKTEILARRLAGLKGILAEMDQHNDSGPTDPLEDDPADSGLGGAVPGAESLRRMSAAGGARDGENWTVLF